MSVPTVSWDETAPAGGDNVSAGDNRIRELKGQVREVVDIDHKFDSSGQDADMGKHNQVSFLEAADVGTGAEGKPILGAQTVNGKAELLFTDEDDNDIQLTTAGKLDLGSGRLDNDENLTGRNNAGDGDVNIVKVNTSDQAEVGAAALATGGVILPEITLPVTAANQGALYTKNDGTQTELYFGEESAGDEVQITKGGNINQTGFGSWVDKGTSAVTATQAATDGFFIGIVTVASSTNFGYIEGFTDASATPTTLRGAAAAGQFTGSVSQSSIWDSGSFMIPVKSGDYYKSTVTASSTATYQFYWIPLGV